MVAFQHSKPKTWLSLAFGISNKTYAIVWINHETDGRQLTELLFFQGRAEGKYKYRKAKLQP
jgi:hypothetical protein